MYRWHEDAYRTHDQATVLVCRPVNGRFEVELTDTILYPEGGGQPADYGWLGSVAVSDVQRRGDVVVHTVDEPVEAGAVEVRLDWPRRLDHMQQHTAQHLLTAILQDSFGVATTSFHLGATECAIELDVAELEPEVFSEAEARVNVAIREARPVGQREVDAATLDAMAVRTRGLPDGFEGPVRLVEIAGLDLNTCGGTHVRNTAELQAVVLLGQERRSGRCLLRFVAGGRVLDGWQAARAREASLSRLLRAGPATHTLMVEKLMQQRKESERRVRSLEGQLGAALSSELCAREDQLVTHHLDGFDLGFLQRLAGQVLRAMPDKRLVLTATDSQQRGAFLVAGESTWVTTAGPLVASRLNARGGGAKGRFQGRCESGVLRSITWEELSACVPGEEQG